MNKSTVIRARATPAEKAALALAAQQDGLRVSEALRAMVREAAQRRGLWSAALEMGTQQEQVQA